MKVKTALKYYELVVTCEDKIMKDRQLYEKLRIVIVGHVDHGKSTLIGRLLYDTNSLPDGSFEGMEKASKKRGDVMEWSFLLDSFQAERDQAVTIDTTQINFTHNNHKYVIIDSPGHTEFLRNMISGAAQADAAILVVDADEGVQEQTKRHAYLLSMLGLRQVAVVINKMDNVDYDIKIYEKIASDVASFLKSINIRPTKIVPISARNGDMIVTRGDHLDWYEGRPLLDVLEGFDPSRPPIARDMRFPVQDVYRSEEKRVIVGRVESGIVRTGSKILLSPTNEDATIVSIEKWPKGKIEKVEAKAGECIGITLDKPVFVERGHVISLPKTPPMLSNVFRVHLFWLSKKPLKVGDVYKISLSTFKCFATVQSIDRGIDTNDLSFQEKAEQVGRNQVAEVTLRTHDMIALDPYENNYKMGRIVLYDAGEVCGGGTISMEDYADQRRLQKPKSENIQKVDHLMSYSRRVARNGYGGGVFWLTGLSGSGKSTLAMEVERILFDKGYQTYVLDGDNVRHGLNADLGFSPEDRAENIRRVGEVSSLMASAGIICITAFISPYRSDRNRARESSPNHFHEIAISASLHTCEERDSKGLYKKARKGEITDFTGISSPYEVPENPDLTINTEVNNIETCVSQIVAYIENNIKLTTEELDLAGLENLEEKIRVH